MKPLRAAIVAVVLCAAGAGAQERCVGDCDNSNVVDITEMLTGIGIALETLGLEACPAFDGDGDGTVAVNELVSGINNNLGGCPSLLPVCSFGGAGNTLQVCLQGGVCLPTTPPSGEVAFDCGDTGPDGVRECACLFRRFDPVIIDFIGYVCVTEPRDEQGRPVQCSAGRQDCSGVGPVGIDLVASHEEAGSCPEGHAQCRELCDTYCAGLQPPKERFNSGCESFCQGGDRADLPCECDVLGASGCALESTLDCPNGSCEGQNDEDLRPPDRDGNDCHCQCIDEGFGGASPPGSLRCRLPTNIRVELGEPCDGADVLVQLPPLCSPLTTATHTARLTSANESDTGRIEGMLEGAPVTCEQLDSGLLTGMRLVTNLAFFDSTVGDLISPLQVQCQ